MLRHKRISILFTVVALLALSTLLVTYTRNAPLLPHSIYYLAGSSGIFQVWRMETDGITAAHLTDEPNGVDQFSVSRVDGSLAFVSNNQLFLVDSNGRNRQLIADGTQAAPDVFRATVGSPVFSPDGRTLAYGFNGLHLFDIASSKDQHVLTNLGNLLGESFVFSKENYFPGPWSPDGRKLLILMSYFEGSTLAIMEPGKQQPFVRLRSSGPVCCTYHWAPDGKTILVANASFGDRQPGLWRYDVVTGEETALIVTAPGQFRFVGWPVQLASGDLRLFYGEQFSPESGVPLIMGQISPQGENWTPLRSEEFHAGQVLWADDGSLALIHTFIQFQDSTGGSSQLVLTYPDARPLQVLLDGQKIRQIQWGP